MNINRLFRSKYSRILFICILSIAVLLIFVNGKIKFFSNGDKNNKILSLENSYIGKSEINGLYYAKRKDNKPDLYSTAYSNQMLRLLKLKFNEKTYNIILNNKQDDGSFKFSEPGYDDPIYTTYLSYLALEPKNITNKQIENTLLKYMQEDGSFLYKDSINISDNKEIINEKKIIYTYMSIYILTKAGVGTSKLSSTIDWLKRQMELSSIKQNITLYARLAETLSLIKSDLVLPAGSIKDNEIQSNIVKIINQNWDANKANDIEGIVILNSLGIINISDNDKEIIKLRCLKMLLNEFNDKQLSYQILNSYVQLKGDINEKDVKLLGEQILSEELVNGGVSNTINIGTPKETLMALVIMKENDNINDDKKLISNLNTLLDDVVNGKINRYDNADIYSLIASIKLLDGNNLNLTDSQKNFFINNMKPFIETNLTSQNWRDWFYAVKTLELINYKFNNNDLPKNYNLIINSISQDGFIKIASNKDENEILTTFIIDALASITENISKLEKLKLAMLNLSNTKEADEFVLKKRYYATMALLKMGIYPENIDETLKICDKLKYNMGYKATYNMADSDLQSTFQVINLKSIKKRKGADLYR